MQRKGLTSTIIISIFVLINLFIFFTMLIHADPADLSAGVNPEEMGEMSILAFLIYGYVMVFIWGWMLLIALTHAICLIFTIRNRKADSRTIRIINIVLDVCNVALIITPILKIWVF